MAYVDRFLTLSGSIVGNTVAYQNLFASGASVLSTDAIDLGIAREVGEGNGLYGRVQIGAAFTGGTSVDFQIIASDNANGTGNVTVVGSTGAIPIAQLVAGARFAFRINPRLASRGQRFLTGNAVNVGANAAGTAFVDIGLEIQDGAKFYASGYVVA